MTPAPPALDVSVIPYVDFLGENRFFCLDGDYWRDGGLEYCRRIWDLFRERGHEINTWDLTPPAQADRLLLFNFNPRALRAIWQAGKLAQTVLVAFEPPVVQPMHSPASLRRLSRILGRVLTWQDDLLATPNIEKFHFPLPTPPRFDPLPFAERKFISAIYNCKSSRRSGELYSERVRTIRFFESSPGVSFDLFGQGWNADEYPSYRGTVPVKHEVLRQYRFSISYENEGGINGLLSEKIFDCFFAGTIPVFWGADNVERYFPPLTYIDRRQYRDHASLLTALQAMDEAEFNARLAAIAGFLDSAQFRERHSPDAFARRLLDVCETDFPTRRPATMDLTGVLLDWLRARLGPA